jgi:Tol biopolymer transport system component
MAVRILVVLTTLAVFYGCDQPGSPPEQGERDGGVEHKSATSSGPSRQETTRQEATRQEATRQDVADMKIAFGVRRPGGGYDYDYDYDLYVMNAGGSNLARLADGADPAWSPDGKRLAYTKYVEEPNPERTTSPASASPPRKIDTPYIFTMNADGSGQKKLLDKAAANPEWSPDGKEIAFDDNYCGIYVMDADGSGTPRKLATGPGCASSPAWSPDGKEIAYTKGSASKASDIYVANASGEDGHAQQPCVLTDHAPRLASAGAYAPDWSPDGTEIAFTFQKSGARISVYKMDADGSGVTPLATSQHVKKVEAATGGGDVTDSKISPVWSPDGEHLAYVRVVPYCAPADCSAGIYSLNPREIYVANSDGTNATLVRELGNKHDIWGLDWKPLS